MGRSPLDSAFSSGGTQQKSKKGFFYLLLLGVAGMATASSVFAASVTINSGSAISYTQGVQTIAACDTDGITAALGAVYVPASSAFALDIINLSGIADTCDNKSLTMEIYDDTDLLLTITGTLATPSGTSTAAIGISGTSLAGQAATSSPTAGTFTNIDGTVSIVYDTTTTTGTALLVASSADRIVIEIN